MLTIKQLTTISYFKIYLFHTLFIFLNFKIFAHIYTHAQESILSGLTKIICIKLYENFFSQSLKADKQKVKVNISEIDLASIRKTWILIFNLHMLCSLN